MSSKENLASSSISISKEKSLEDWLRDIDVDLKDSKSDKEKLYNQMCKGVDKVRIGSKNIKKFNSQLCLQFGETAQLLWRKAKAAHLLSVVADKKGEKNKKKDLIFETLRCAEKAVELDANCADCHKWYAIALGSITDYVGTKERIEVSDHSSLFCITHYYLVPRRAVISSKSTLIEPLN